MAHSSRAGKEWIRSRLSAAGEVSRILDVGVGAGGYSDLFHSEFPKADWTGLEAWGPYIEQFNLKQKYNRLIVCDVRWLDFVRLGSFDLCFCGDIIEHMQIDEARVLVNRLLKISKIVFIAIPLGYCPLEPYDGNFFERHVVDNYTDETVRSTYPGIVEGWIETEGPWTLGSYALSLDESVKEKLLAMRKREQD